MKRGVWAAAVLGLAATTAIIGYIGFGAVLSALTTIGWRGLGVLTAYSVAPFALLGGAWFVLIPRAPAGAYPALVWARVARDAGGELLPFSPLGGWVIGARAAMLAGIAPSVAYSTTLADVTTELIAQIGFTGLGLGLLAMRLGSASMHDALASAVIIGLLLTGAGAVAFITLQRRGAALVEALARRWSPGAALQAADVGRTLATLYDRPARIMLAVGLHFAGWLVSAVGCWLALEAAGISISLTSVLAIESLVTAARSAVVVAPMGVGVQEGAYALIGPLFGLGAETSLALSLLKRARDLVIGLPALLIWQGLEARRLAHARSGPLTADLDRSGPRRG